MRATIIHGPGDIRVEDRDYPAVQLPTDVVVKVTASCVCGSDLWPYRGVKPIRKPAAIGHEFVGVVESVGADVTALAEGDFVIAPFVVSCGECPQCRNGVTVACDRLAGWGGRDSAGHRIDGGQGQAVRVPLAESTLVKVPGVTEPDAELTANLLTLSDVMATGHHAALSAKVAPGRTVVVVGDGAVGLCGVLAARRLGAERIIAMSRHADRQAMAREFGATDIVEERGDDGVAKVRDLLGGVLADSVLECVGTKESMEQALHCVRPGGALGFVGVPTGGAEVTLRYLFDSNVSIAGGMAPARTYIPELLADVLAGTINPGRVFDSVMPLEEAAEAYRAMDERRAIKVLLTP
ncbi:zinc-dependent alcohol dehydrogenase family protein [Arthrobacter oryzae]|jgi:threonine dehydrogenase-like Zn-dependent dehydrogenase|uniref:zinc-dependent alcohol dehydrogenase family protein n=1 Tax=Arthrobacter oryzae TaxID=409290 RepID=UPI00277D5693|nr:zinc-dependent alcohol dehydrogenase family protein [Arthrobacter oryzae]MDQ0076304.1 threonine dehydrogenase-like Zn-dependent dehydrogenase [Arthrobacter oryzae]